MPNSGGGSKVIELKKSNTLNLTVFSSENRQICKQYEFDDYAVRSNGHETAERSLWVPSRRSRNCSSPRTPSVGSSSSVSKWMELSTFCCAPIARESFPSSTDHRLNRPSPPSSSTRRSGKTSIKSSSASFGIILFRNTPRGVILRRTLGWLLVLVGSLGFN